MKNRVLFALAGVGLLLGIAGAWYFGRKHAAEPPAFQPAANPYAAGIYANGIVESAQASGANVNLYPEVAGPVRAVRVAEGATVRAGAPLLVIDASVAEAQAGQLRAQAAAAAAALAALRHAPRPETLAVARAGVGAAEASLRQVSDQRDKLRRSAELDARSVSAEQLDTAENAVRVAAAGLEVARRQFELVQAGAWRYDLENQQRAAEAARKAADAADALLAKFTLRAPVDGTVLAVAATVGSYVSPQGTYDAYTQTGTPVVVMTGSQRYLGVRVYVDEILLSRLPPPGRLVAQMQVRGTDLKVPLEFVRVQPYVTPKVELSNQRAERVDLRVLPVLFRFAVSDAVHLYPGQLVDVYIGSR
jgi:HlyD family secretion protein